VLIAHCFIFFIFIFLAHLFQRQWHLAIESMLIARWHVHQDRVHRHNDSASCADFVESTGSDTLLTLHNMTHC